MEKRPHARPLGVGGDRATTMGARIMWPDACARPLSLKSGRFAFFATTLEASGQF